MLLQIRGMSQLQLGAPVARRGVRSLTMKRTLRSVAPCLGNFGLFGSRLMTLFFWIQEGGGSARTDSQSVQRAKEKRQRGAGSHAGEAACAGPGRRGDPGRGTSGFKTSAALWSF